MLLDNVTTAKLTCVFNKPGMNEHEQLHCEK